MREGIIVVWASAEERTARARGFTTSAPAMSFVFKLPVLQRKGVAEPEADAGGERWGRETVSESLGSVASCPPSFSALPQG
jgi:hypothetical protein